MDRANWAQIKTSFIQLELATISGNEIAQEKYQSWLTSQRLAWNGTTIVSVLSTGTRPGLVFPQACLALLVAITDKVSESPFFQVDWVAIMLLITCIFFQCRSKNMFIPGLSWIYIPWGILSLPFEVPLVWKSREKMLCQNKIEGLEKMSCFSWFYWTWKKKILFFYLGDRMSNPNSKQVCLFCGHEKTCKHAMGSWPKTRIKTGNVLFSIFPELTKVSVSVWDLLKYEQKKSMHIASQKENSNEMSYSSQFLPLMTAEPLVELCMCALFLLWFRHVCLFCKWSQVSCYQYGIFYPWQLCHPTSTKGGRGGWPQLHSTVISQEGNTQKFGKLLPDTIINEMDENIHQLPPWPVPRTYSLKWLSLTFLLLGGKSSLCISNKQRSYSVIPTNQDLVVDFYKA